MKVCDLFSKVDWLMGRNWPKGALDDAMYAILCAAREGLRLLLRAVASFFASIRSA
jgi:hypothetical protein